MIPQGAEKRRLGRQRLWAVLHDGKGKAGHRFNFLLTLLILVSVALVPLEFLPTFPRFAYIVQIIEAVIIACFTVEYILRIYAAPNRWKYIFSFFGIVDLLSIVPFYSGIFNTEYIRILRFIRFLKLAEIEAAAETDEVETMQHDMGLLEGETVEYIVTKSVVVLFIGILPPIVAVMFGIGVIITFTEPIGIAIGTALFFFALIFLWKAWLDFSYDVIYVTNYRLIFQNQHILGRSINQVNYYAVTNVKPYYPTALSFIFRYGSLVIDTAAEHPGQIGMHMVKNHEHAAHVIMQKCYAAQAGTITSVSTPEASAPGPLPDRL